MLIDVLLSLPPSSSSASSSSSFSPFCNSAHRRCCAISRTMAISQTMARDPWHRKTCCCIAMSPCRSVPLMPSSPLLVSPAPASAATWNSRRAPTGIHINSNAAATLSFGLLMAALFLNDGSGSGGQAGGHLIQVRTCECALAQSAVGWTGMHLYACVCVCVCCGRASGIPQHFPVSFCHRFALCAISR